MINFKLIIAEDNFFITRIFNCVIAVVVFGVVFSLTLFSSLISESAKAPTKPLYKYLMKNKTLTMKERLKIESFIARLDKRDIGFYCWKLFPMNSFRFFEYVSACFVMYILVIDIVTISSSEKFN